MSGGRFAVESIARVSDVPAADWDAISGPDDPFSEHAFLRALEVSESVGGRSGWEPMHLVARDVSGALVGALPLYLKAHSYGEYIFDFAWANASMRLGAPYYPKLVAMTPLTPATGTRILVHPERDARAIRGALIDAAVALAERLDVSSLHLNFLNEDERDDAAAHPRLLARVTQQFHWHNAGYRDMDDYFGHFRASMRKKARKERRLARESGFSLDVVSGTDLSSGDWARVRDFYRDTCWRKGSEPYLRDAFFDEIATTFAHRVVLGTARGADGELVAATLNFEKGRHLYGRYWGARDDYEMLHFELCYYALIERAIERGHRRFEAGAQGTHKLRRGLMPSPIHSAHFISHPRLRDAVADFLPRERAGMEYEMTALRDHGPFRRGEG